MYQENLTGLCKIRIMIWETNNSDFALPKDNTVHRLNIRVRLCSHHLSFHLRKKIPIKSIQVTVYEWALEFMYTKMYCCYYNYFFCPSFIFPILYFFLSFFLSYFSSFRPSFLLPWPYFLLSFFSYFNIFGDCKM